MILVPKKKPAPSFLPYLMASVYLGMFTVWICLLSSLMHKDTTNAVLLGGTVGICMLFSLAMREIFAWYLKAELKLNNGVLNYDVTDVIDVLGNSVTKHEILKIDDYSIKDDKMILYGEFSRKEPLSQPKKISKLVIEDITDEAKEMILKYKEAIESE